MSIEELIEEYCDKGRLFPIEPLLGDPVVRGLYVSEKIHKELPGPWNDEWDEVAWGKMREVMDTFVSGRWISVGKKKKEHHMTLLDRPSDGVWDMRATEPDSGLRALGQFAKKDLFIALDWEYRRDIYDLFQWKRVSRNCKALWRNYFYNYNPISSENPHDYISKIILG